MHNIAVVHHILVARMIEKVPMCNAENGFSHSEQHVACAFAVPFA